MPLHPLILVSVLCLAACSSRGAAELPLAANCVAEGEFRVNLYGALRSNLEWRGSQLQCAGMPRPEGAGARLRFAGEIPLNDTMHELAFIVALPDLERGGTGRELRATVTLIEEDNGRFFSNAEQETCWADVAAQRPLPDAGNSYFVSGIVYCVAPLAELASTASVTIRDLAFAGRVDWQGANP